MFCLLLSKVFCSVLCMLFCIIIGNDSKKAGRHIAQLKTDVTDSTMV